MMDRTVCLGLNREECLRHPLVGQRRLSGPRRLLSTRWHRATVLVSVAVLSATVGAQGGSTQAAPTTLSLEQALQYALDHYPTVRAALEQVNASTANVSAAKAAYLPRFDAVWQTNRATANNIFGQLLPQSVMPSISGPVLPSASGESVWGSAAGGLFSWEPVDFGLRSATVREAEAGVARARAEEGLTQLAVQNAVGVAFLALVTAQQAAAAADADVQRREVLARAARTLADNQLRPGAEASRADAELAAARTRAIQAHEAVTLAQTTLARMLGMPDRVVGVNTVRLLDKVAATAPPAVSAPQHPLVQSERAAVDLARAREAVLTKTDRPRLFLQSSVSARGSGANPDGVFDSGADGLGLERANWAAGVQVVFPNLFDFSSLRARRSAASALTRAENARYDEAVLTVTSRQREADAMVDAARAIAQNTPVQLTAAQQSEAQARARYNAGLASITEVAEAQNLLAAAEYQDAAARVDVWRALLARAAAQGSLTSFLDLLRTSSGVQ
jgi:outer membrane protein